MLPLPDLLWPAGLAILGAIVGSFLATIVIRWPEGRSAMRGRSACDACARTLTARDLVPLASAAMMRGRCRTCGAAIDPRHWRVEAAAALVGLLAALATPSPLALAGAVFGWLLLVLAAIDWTDHWLPDELSVSLALSGFASSMLTPLPTFQDRCVGAAVGLLSLWALAVIYGALRKREVMGEGDPKLLFGIGAWLGWTPLPMVLLGASVFGLTLALVGRLRGREVTWVSEVPFGTFLAIAAYPAWLVMIAFGP